MTIAVSLLAALAAATAIWLLGTVMVAAVLRVPVKSLAFGLGPTLATVNLGRMPLELKPFPVASNVTFVEPQNVLAPAQPFATLGRGRKILLALSGCIVTAATALLVLGPERALGALVATWAEVFRPVTLLFDPAGHWQPMIEAAQTNPFAILVALASAKVAAFNILPLAGLSGWSVLEYMTGTSPAERPAVMESIAKFSMFVLLGLIFLWALSGAEFAMKALGVIS